MQIYDLEVFAYDWIVIFKKEENEMEQHNYQRKIKTVLINDNFQSFKRYNIPKAQLVIADIPYNLGVNAYASNPVWYVGGDIAGFLYHGKMIVAEGVDGQAGVTYEPDFVVLNNDNTYEIIDTKGVETQVFKTKIKVLRNRYPNVEIKTV